MCKCHTWSLNRQLHRPQWKPKWVQSGRRFAPVARYRTGHGQLRGSQGPWGGPGYSSLWSSCRHCKNDCPTCSTVLFIQIEILLSRGWLAKIGLPRLLSFYLHVIRTVMCSSSFISIHASSPGLWRKWGLTGGVVLVSGGVQSNSRISGFMVTDNNREGAWRDHAGKVNTNRVNFGPNFDNVLTRKWSWESGGKLMRLTVSLCNS